MSSLYPMNLRPRSVYYNDDDDCLLLVASSLVCPCMTFRSRSHRRTFCGTASAQRRCGEGRYAEEARHVAAVMSSHGFVTAQFAEERAASAAADAARKQTRSRDIRVLDHGRHLLCTDKACSVQGKSNGNAVPAVRKISHPPRPERAVVMRHAYSMLWDLQ